MTTLRVVCSSTWPAKTACRAWAGVPSSHGCRKHPGHDGLCQCLCGSAKPISEHSERPASLVLRHDPDPEDSATARTVRGAE